MIQSKIVALQRGCRNFFVQQVLLVDTVILETDFDIMVDTQSAAEYYVGKLKYFYGILIKCT